MKKPSETVRRNQLAVRLSDVEMQKIKDVARIEKLSVSALVVARCCQ